MRIKVTPEVVEALRREYTGKYGSLRALAEKYRVSVAHTQRILRNKVHADPNYVTKYSKSSAKRQDWRPIPGFPGYEINSAGEIWCITAKKHRKVRVCSAIKDAHGKLYQGALSRLILMAFAGPPPFPKAVARHLDDNPENNTVENLAWGSYKDNHADAVRNGRIFPKGHPKAKRQGAHALGKPRTKEVRAKISATKRANYDRQNYHLRKDSKGRWAKESPDA